MNSDRLTDDEILSHLESQMQTALEYGKLLSLPHLSEDQADRLGMILEQAIDNSVLHFCLTEVDHFISHHLGLLDEDDRESYKDQQALVKEYLGLTICQAPISPEFEQTIANQRHQILNDASMPAATEAEEHDEATLNQIHH